jgi:hypothetical protein
LVLVTSAWFAAACAALQLARPGQAFAQPRLPSKFGTQRCIARRNRCAAGSFSEHGQGSVQRPRFATVSLKRRIGISCRSAELAAFEDRGFVTVRRVGHGAGHDGTHEHCIWHRRYRRPCCWCFHGRLCLCLSRGSSRRRGREGSKTPAGGEGETAQAAWQHGGLDRPHTEGATTRRTVSGLPLLSGRDGAGFAAA